ncbi:MAG: DUF896 domain-containing protein [Christensenellales bacterium]|jgi:uncharacterized protein YnzC (UPF0291/DUF896 family)
MTNERIQRINKLARKEKKEGLTVSEKEEQAALRREYIDDLKRNLQLTLDSTYIVSQDGTKRRLERGVDRKGGRLH